MIEETYTDIMKAPAYSLLLCQANAHGYAQTSLMQKILRDFPDLYKEFKKYCSWFDTREDQEKLIGSMMGQKLPDNTNRILCNVFTQRFIGKNVYQVDYEAWKTVLKKIIKQTKANFKVNGIMYEIHVQNKIGSNMTALEQQNIKTILDTYFKSSDIKLVYHK